MLAANNGTLNIGESPVGQPVVQSYKVTQSFDTLSLQATGPYRVTLVEDTGFGFGNPPSSAYVSQWRWKLAATAGWVSDSNRPLRANR